MKLLKNKIISWAFLMVFLASCNSSEPKEAWIFNNIAEENIIKEQTTEPGKDITPAETKSDIKEAPAEDGSSFLEGKETAAPEEVIVEKTEETSSFKYTLKEEENIKDSEVIPLEEAEGDRFSESHVLQEKSVEELFEEIVIDNSFFTEKVDAVFAGRGLNSAYYGIKVVNLSKGETIFERNENSSFIPASNTKLYTAAAALEILGKDYKFETKLAYRGDILSDGTLDGDLYIIGGGDPTLGSKYMFNRRFNMQSRATPSRINTQLAFLDEWTEEVKSLGINRINGRILVDNSHYSQINTAIDTWEWKDMSTSFGALPSGVNILDNAVLVGLARDKKTTITPSTSTVHLVNNTVNSGANRVTLSVPPYSDKIVAVGEVSTSVNKDVPVPNPSMLLGDLFRRNLQSNGISTGDEVEAVQSSSGSEVFFTHYSPPLERIALLMNSYSINLYAEALKLEAEKKLARKRPISLSRYWYETLGLEGFRLYDGSGLSRYNRVTPNNTIVLLAHMHSSELARDYYKSLAVAGNLGTLQDFNKAPLRSNLHAKSGTLTGVKSYSGYITNSNDELLAFSIMVNLHDLSNSEITGKLEEIMSEMYKLQ